MAYLAPVGAAGHADGLVAGVEALSVNNERCLVVRPFAILEGPLGQCPQIHYFDITTGLLLHRLEHFGHLRLDMVAHDQPVHRVDHTVPVHEIL